MKHFKKIILGFFILSVLSACKKESLNPLPGWEDGATGFGQLDYVSATSGSSVGFKAGGMDTSKVIVSISWNNFGKDVTINKIEAYVHWVETYFNNTRQQNVTVEHSAPEGKTDPSLVINATDRRVQYPLTITPDKIFNLFKDNTFTYNGPTAVNVFQNPEKPFRTNPKTRFSTLDRFYVTWYLYATDGRVFKSWAISIQTGELAGANTRVDFRVVP